jgi:hypothetical protein
VSGQLTTVQVEERRRNGSVVDESPRIDQPITVITGIVNAGFYWTSLTMVHQ